MKPLKDHEKKKNRGKMLTQSEATKVAIVVGHTFIIIVQYF